RKAALTFFGLVLRSRASTSSFSVSRMKTSGSDRYSPVAAASSALASRSRASASSRSASRTAAAAASRCGAKRVSSAVTTRSRSAVSSPGTLCRSCSAKVTTHRLVSVPLSHHRGRAGGGTLDEAAGAEECLEVAEERGGRLDAEGVLQAHGRRAAGAGEPQPHLRAARVVGEDRLELL